MQKVRILIILPLLSLQLFAQKTSFDLARFALPAGWTKTNNNGVLLLSPAPKGNSYCMVSLYPSVNSAGSVTNDFNAAWKQLVADRLSPLGKPQTEKGESENGWDNLTGYAYFKLDGNKMLALLTTSTGYDKAMSMLLITNDQAYEGEINGFLNSFEMTKPSGNLTPPTPANNGAPGTLADYQFTPPPGWTKQVSNSEIVLRGPDNKSVLSLLPMQASSGNLEKDMQNIFWQVFTGWGPDPYNSDDNTVTRGYSAQGWAYYKDERGIRKEEGGKVYQAYGFILLCLVNNQVAVIAGSYPDGTSRLRESMYTDWIQFYHSLGFKNFKGSSPQPLSKAIIGNWIVGSGSGVVTYTFAGNGRYQDGAAFSTSNQISDYQVLERTTSFVGNGRYSIAGNELTLVNDRTKKARVGKLRIFDQFMFGAWKHKIGMLERSVDGSLYEVTMIPYQ